MEGFLEIDVVDYLKSEITGPVTYIPNPGNAGDALIAAATFQCLDRLKVDYTLSRRDRESFKGDFLLYGGGGNFGLVKNFSSRLLRRVHQDVKRLVILPHTIKDVSPILAEFGSNVDVICRERQSYNYVKSVAHKARVFLAHDMALQLDVDQLLHGKPRGESVGSLLVQYGVAKLRLNGLQSPPLSAIKGAARMGATLRRMAEVAPGEKLNAFRTDSEKTDIPIPVDNLDVSELLSMGVENRDLAMLTSRSFMSFLSRYKTIRTNRLHVCIGAALLGKQVDFFDNSYYKCRAVYEHSLKDFANVRYIPSAAA